MKRHLLLSIITVFLFGLSAQAQTNYLMSNTAVTVTCPASNTYFYDDGNSGGNYLASKNFTKTFTSSNGQSLQFSFTSFSTQSGNDILTIYDGPDNTFPVIGQFSGVISPGNVVSSSTSLTFNWVSDATTNKAGWAATITCVNAPPTYNMAAGTINICDALFYDDGGVGGNYLNNDNITETFTSNNGTCMRATFYGFTVQAGDVLNIYDGPNTASPLIGNFSGVSLPFTTLLASTGSLTFNFTSNGATVGGGWSAVMSCDVCPPPAPSTTNATYTMGTVGLNSTYLSHNLVNTCSGTLADNGDFSGNYSNNINSIYRVFCPNTAGNCERISFFSMNITSPDYLQVNNKATQNGTNISGNMNGSCTDYASCMGKGFGPFTSYDQSGCLSLRFNSGTSGNNSGFAATLDCVPCASGPTGTTNADCSLATPICSDASFDDASTGPGLISEAGAACTISENYSNWYSFTVFSSGTIGLTIDPITNANDYDFAIFGPGVTCGTLGAPIRCSYSGVTGNTGLGNGAADFSEGAAGNGWVSTMNVIAGETYYLLVSSWSPGADGFGLTWNLTNGASLICPLLPVQLTSFTCQPEVGLITLDWHSQSEYNNNHYMVEKSFDGENYSLLTTVPGKGTTAQPTEYFVADNEPYAGNNFYRLSQVDENGITTKLETITCTYSDPNEEVTLEVFDLSGKLIYTKEFIVSNYEPVMHELDLANGVYLTAIIHSNGIADLNKYLKMH